MLKIITFVAVAYLLICLLLFLQQRAMLYFPSAESTTSSAQHMWIDSDQHRLKVWKVNRGEAAILYFGGNAEAVENNIHDFRELFPLHTVYLVNYRGYGGSSGKPSEQALFTDALNIYDAIHKSHTRISVIGRSLGSGVACYLAAQRDVEKLLLVTPYDSMANLAQTHYPLLPAKWLLQDRFESTRYAPSISSPTLLLMAEHDRVVPRKHSLQLAEALLHVGPVTEVIAGSQHNTISANRQYRELLQSFMQGEDGGKSL